MNMDKNPFQPQASLLIPLHLKEAYHEPLMPRRQRKSLEMDSEKNF